MFKLRVTPFLPVQDRGYFNFVCLLELSDLIRLVSGCVYQWGDGVEVKVRIYGAWWFVVFKLMGAQRMGPT